MRTLLLPLAAALALGGAATAPTLALAQAPRGAAATPPQTQLAAKLLDFIDYKASVRAHMTGSNLPPELVAVRPDWEAMWRQAMGEELDHDMPTIESMVGQALVKTFTEDEMKAGMQIVSDPGLKAVYLAAQNGAQPPQGASVSKATDDLMNTPNGSSFVSKLQKIETVMDPVQIEVMATVMPGVMKRFGEKADAAEVQKRAAAGYASAK
ncbi:MAG TPA: hypothetical protein VGM25_05045 [Caulobacteraceae bacterium]|jgi:hypothetical protein